MSLTGSGPSMSNTPGGFLSSSPLQLQSIQQLRLSLGTHTFTHTHTHARRPPVCLGEEGEAGGVKGGSRLPVHHGASVEGHEEDLTAAAGSHGGEENLRKEKGRSNIRTT